MLFGSINTAVLIASSFTMVLAVRAAELRQRSALAGMLWITAGLGLAFLAIKGFEYHHEIVEGLWPGEGFHLASVDRSLARMFFYLYFLMTGVHAVHVFIGIIMIGIFAIRVRATPAMAPLVTSIDLLGLYWHFVDIVWVFLFPLLYLVGRSS